MSDVNPSVIHVGREFLTLPKEGGGGNYRLIDTFTML